MRQYAVAFDIECRGNHVHLMSMPETKDGLKLVVGEAYRHSSRRIIFHEVWRRHL
jgi:putative transposase